MLLLFLAVATAARKTPAAAPYLHAPAVLEYARHDPGGLTILPTGRHLKPVGRHMPLAQWPHGLAQSPDGTTLFVASEGVGQLITGWEGLEADGPLPPVVTRIKPGQGELNGGGAVFSPDGKTLYWSSGDAGGVYVVDVASGRVTQEIALNGPLGDKTFADSVAIDLQLSEDGTALYAADVTNFRLAVIDTRTRRMVGSAPVGRYPYAVSVVGRHAYVAHIGMFSYSPIPKPTDGRSDPRGLTFPPFGFPSREAEVGVTVEGRRVPGLGDPNAPESFSVWGVEVTDPARPRVARRIKTGLPVFAPADQGTAVGGSGPNFLVARSDALFVSNGNNDSIERFDPLSGRRVWRTGLAPSPLVARLRGVGPSGMALSPDGTRLYVAESGINALAVLETQGGRVLGHIPTAWYPYRVTVSRDGRRLAVIGFRGFGNGPKGVRNPPPSPYLGMQGSLSVLDVPADRDLPRHTRDVLAYNGIVDASADRAAFVSPLVPTTPGTASREIKHVVFITKENHTFDTIFDRVPGTNHDPSLLRWGYHQRVEAPGQPTLEDVAVMTNHNALARQFTVSDNFYMEPEASGVGHCWLVGIQPNNWRQMTYTLGWRFKGESPAPGRRNSFGSNGSMQPEDYLEAGSMWEHLARHGKRFRNYGEGFEFAGVGEGEDEEPTGARETVNIPMPKVLFDNTCREYPIFNMNIPDQFRADWFIKDFSRLYLNGRERMPSFINIALCNDHGTAPRPEKGYPYLASWMADNDLALGRIVEFLSRTPYWKNMAIFVTQDDAGGEPDHVDAQRSVLMVISPWAKRGYVSHRLTTIVSMHRTLYQILGLPPLNMFDALANDFSDCFTTTPDFRPYKTVPVDPRIFDPAKTRDPKDPNYRRAASTPSIVRDNFVTEERVERMGRRQRAAAPRPAGTRKEETDVNR
jgi:YVTN family beta-propeller protein